MNLPSWSLKQAIDAFMEEGFKDGDLVSHDWLRWALAINDHAIQENEFVLLERMESLKSSLLITHNIALQNIRGKGYRVVPPAEQARYAAEESARHIEKGMRKATQLLRHTRVEQLDHNEKKRHTDTEVRMAALNGMLDKGRRDVFKAFLPGKQE
jgi:hypothetical protein